MKKKEKKPSNKNIASVLMLKNGSFSLATIAIVLAIIVVVNLIVGQLPESMLTLDLSETGIFSITDTSKELLDSLDKDIKIEVVAENGSVDTRIEKFLDIYGDLSSHVSVIYTDPVLHPEVLTEYGISANSVVVSCEETGKNQVISFSDIIVSEYNYYYYSSVETEFDAEGQLTSAVSAVIADNEKMIYLLRGHGEEALSASVGELLTKNSMDTANLNLLEEDHVPEDCDLLIINNPTSDLGFDEYTAIHNFLYMGGNVLLIRNATDSDLTNLDALMEDYGLTMVNSYIGDRELYYSRAGSAFYFFPEITGSDINVSSSSLILVGPVAGMNQSESVPEDVTVTSLLTTSDNAFREGNSEESEQFLLAASSVKEAAVTEEEELSLEEGTSEELSTVDEAEEEESGTEAVSAEGEDEISEGESTEAEETLDSILTDISASGNGDPWMETAAGTSNLTVLTASTMISSSITDSFSGIENLNEFINIVSSYFDDVQNVSIPAKSLEVSYNTVNGGGIWNTLFIGIIPVFSIVFGLFIWIRRRKA